MQFYDDLFQPISCQDTALTIGMFDGVHLGHQSLIRATVAAARASGRRAGLVTFFPHPAVVLGTAEPLYLMSNEAKLAEFERLGLDLVVRATFSRTLSQLRAAELFDLLYTNLTMRELWIGYDFALGHRREGDATLLQSLGRQRGLAVHQVAPLLRDGLPVSSSRIRNALQAGEVAQANAWLGRPYRLGGPVVLGAQRGRTLGFPTANLSLPADCLLPRNGVYACFAHVGDAIHHAVVNVGNRPTFDNGRRSIEAHLLNFAGNLYGQTVALDLVAFLRPEIKHASVAALVDQLHQDTRHAADVLSNGGNGRQPVTNSLPQHA